MNSSANNDDHFYCSICKSSPQRLDNILDETYEDKDYKTKESKDLADKNDKFKNNNEIVITSDQINHKYVNERLNDKFNKKSDYNLTNLIEANKSVNFHNFPYIINSKVNVPSFDLNRRLFEERIKESSRLINRENRLRTKRVLKDKISVMDKKAMNDATTNLNKISIEESKQNLMNNKPVPASSDLYDESKMYKVDQFMKLHERLNETNKQEVKNSTLKPFDTVEHCKCDHSNMTNYDQNSHLVQVNNLNNKDNRKNPTNNSIRIDEQKIIKAIMKKDLISELKERQKVNLKSTGEIIDERFKIKNELNHDKNQLNSALIKTKNEGELIDYCKCDHRLSNNQSNSSIFSNNRTNAINSRSIKERMMNVQKIPENYNTTDCVDMKLNNLDKKMRNVVHHEDNKLNDVDKKMSHVDKKMSLVDKKINHVVDQIKEKDNKNIISGRLNANTSKVIYDGRKNKNIQTNQISKVNQSTQTDKKLNKLKYNLIPVKNHNLASKIIDEILVSRSQL